MKGNKLLEILIGADHAGFELKKQIIDKAMGSILESAAENMVRLFSSRAESVFEEL